MSKKQKWTIVNQKTLFCYWWIKQIELLISKGLGDSLCEPDPVFNQVTLLNELLWTKLKWANDKRLNWAGVSQTLEWTIVNKKLKWATSIVCHRLKLARCLEIDFLRARGSCELLRTKSWDYLWTKLAEVSFFGMKRVQVSPCEQS